MSSRDKKEGHVGLVEEKGKAPLIVRNTAWFLLDSLSSFISAAALLIWGSLSIYKSSGIWGCNVV